MGCLKLEYNNKTVSLLKVNDFYQIKNINEWIMLTKFCKAYLIIYHPNGFIEISIDKKFVYNQDFELSNDLDFQFKYILPLGNFDPKPNTYPHDSSPFTGTLNGNNYIIKNINIIDTFNNGLFGVLKLATIKNMTIQNVVVNGGRDNGSLAGRAYNVDIINLKIIGNILMSGTNCACLASYLEGNIKDINICVDGLIESNMRAIISNKLFGNIENINVITNIEETPGLVNSINGKISHCSLLSFNTIIKPFYEETKYHHISSCYYFQLNNDELPSIQDLYSCYYRNLNNDTVWSNDISSLGFQNWVKIGSYYYLESNINYSNENIGESTDILYYDWSNNSTNIVEHTIINKHKLFNNHELKPFDKDYLLEQCRKMEHELKLDNDIKFKITEINKKICETKVNNVKLRFSDEPVKAGVKTIVPNNKINNKLFDEAEFEILEELKKIIN